MLTNISNLGKVLNRSDLQLINGKGDDCYSTNGHDCQPFNNPNYFNCLRTCAGSCSGSGQCFTMIK